MTKETFRPVATSNDRLNTYWTPNQDAKDSGRPDDDTADCSLFSYLIRFLLKVNQINCLIKSRLFFFNKNSNIIDMRCEQPEDEPAKGWDSRRPRWTTDQSLQSVAFSSAAHDNPLCTDNTTSETIKHKGKNLIFPFLLLKNLDFHVHFDRFNSC